MKFKAGITLVKKSLFSYMSQKGFFWTLTFSWMIGPLIYMFVWIVASGDGPISGFSSSDFITYYAMLIIINQITYPISHWTIGEAIFEGNLSHWLLRPIPPVYEAIATDVSMKLVTAPFIILFVIVIVFILGIDLLSPVSHTGLFILSLIMAQILRFMLGYTLALLALFTQKLDAVLNINNALVFLLAGQIMPVALFPETIRNIVSFLPYRYVLGFPIELALGKLSQTAMIEGLVIQMAWVVIIMVLYRFVWKTGIKRFTAVGG